MASENPARMTIFVAILIAAVWGFTSAASAQPMGLREGLFGARPSEGRTRPPPPVARYVSEEGEAFVLDRSQQRPLMKFESSIEVWALQPQPAPRGDVIYKNDTGEAMLRATRLGGVTVFTETRPGGSAAALMGGGEPLRLAPIGPLALGERLLQGSQKASRAARRAIIFEAEATPRSSSLIADAAAVTAEALTRLAKRADARALFARISRVRLVEGKKASASVNQGVMQITVTPADGLAGRPSSDRIVAVAVAMR
jgi:hypothetical protein